MEGNAQPVLLADTSMEDWCIANIASPYISIEITKFAVGPIPTLIQNQCTASTSGHYIGIEITKLPAGLGGTLM